MNILESILKAISNAALYNKHKLAPPRVILWTDEERLWEQCIDMLRSGYPSLWSLGDYNQEKSTVKTEGRP